MTKIAYYRYEALNKQGAYEGIFSFFNPDHRRYFNRFLREPKWYAKNPGVKSRCWFTQEGYDKYHHVIDDIIIWAGIKNVRLLTVPALNNIACKGKIQCIELATKDETPAEPAYQCVRSTDSSYVTQKSSDTKG